MAKGDTIQAPFPFFIEDFDRDTFHLSLAEQMIYLRALAYIWQHGFIPSEPSMFARCTGADRSREWRKPVTNVQKMLCEFVASLQPVGREFAASFSDGEHRPDKLTQKRVHGERQKYLKNRAAARDRKQREREMSRVTDGGQPRDEKSPIPSPYPLSKENLPPPSPDTAREDGRRLAEVFMEEREKLFPSDPTIVPLATVEAQANGYLAQGVPSGSLEAAIRSGMAWYAANGRSPPRSLNAFKHGIQDAAAKAEPSEKFGDEEIIARNSGQPFKGTDTYGDEGIIRRVQREMAERNGGQQ